MANDPTWQENWLPIAIAWAAATICSLVISRLVRLASSARQSESTLARDLNDLIRNGPWMILFGFGLMRLFAAFVKHASMIYYFKYFVQRQDLIATFLVSGSLAAIFGMLWTSRLLKFFDKRTAMISLSLVTVVCTLGFAFLGPDDIAWMYALNIVASFAAGPGAVLLWAMYADTADYSEWRTRRRATGLLFSAASFSHKLGTSLGAASAGFLLMYFQYTGPINGVDQAQGEWTLQGLTWMMSVIPAAFSCVAVAAMCFYPLTDRSIQRMAATLKKRKANAASDATFR